jgi:hypothetical protein
MFPPLLTEPPNTIVPPEHAEKYDAAFEDDRLPSSCTSPRLTVRVLVVDT